MNKIVSDTNKKHNEHMTAEIRKNYKLNNKEKLSGKTILKSMPVRISVNLTGRCNNKCSYCNLSIPGVEYYTKEEMSFDTFSLLTPFLPTLSYLVYFANAEPLIAKNFKEIYKASSNYSMEKYLSTNGIALTKKMSELLVSGGLNYMQISISGTNKESYRKYHQINCFSIIISHIKELNYIKDKYKTNEPRLRLTFTVMKDNIHELCDAVRLAADLNFSEGVQLRHLIGYKEELYDQIVPESDSPSNTKYVNHIEKAKALAKELHIPLTGDYVNTDIDHKGDHISVTSEEALHMDHLPCYEPFERLHVETDGKVRPCPSYSSNIFAGDLKKQTIWDVWNGEVMQHYRKNVNTINEPEGCKTCLSGHYRKRTRDDIWQQKDMDMLIYKRNNV